MANDEKPPFTSLNTDPEDNKQGDKGSINDDDISVVTASAENRYIQPSSEKKEYVIKFLFRPKKEGDNTEVARTHFAILKTINENYNDTTDIFDNFGQKMIKFSALKSYDQYLRHYKLQYVKGNPHKNRPPIYLVFHRINSSVSISELRKHTVISALLQKVNTRMSTHIWLEDETRISNIGFFVTIDPGNKLKVQSEEDIKKEISAATGRPIKKIPRFQCVFSSPYQMQDDGSKVATKSYDLQCRQQDAKDIVKILHATYKDNPKFIFHRMRHTNATTYSNAIRFQNSYLSKSRVVPIQGVNEAAMFHLEQMLMQIDGVEAVYRHRDTETKGRWSIMTTESKFKPLAAHIKQELPPWVIKNSADYPSPKSFPPPSLAFKNQAYDEESEGSQTSFQSYVSNCSSIYTVGDETYDDPPPQNNPAPQAWTGNSKIPELLDTTVSTPADSGISQDEFDKVQRENTKLSKKIDDLTSQVTALLQSQQQKAPNKYEMDMEMIVAKATEAATNAVMLSMQKLQGESKSTKQKRSHEPNIQDMSYDASDDEGNPKSNNE